MSVQDSLDLLTSNVTNIRNVVNNPLESFIGLAGDSCDLLGTLGSFVDDATKELTRLAENAVAAVLAPVAGIIKIIDDFAGKINNLLEPVLGLVDSAIETVLGQVTQAVGAITGVIDQALTSAVDAVNGAIQQVANTIADALKPLAAVTCNAVSGVIGEIGSGITDTLDAVNNFAEDGIESFIGDKAKSAAEGAKAAAEEQSQALEGTLNSAIADVEGVLP